MSRTKEQIEHELSLEQCRLRWAMEDVTKHDNRIVELKKELAEAN